ncbi:unnamed protein product [Acanthoscelides obtectus]|uniref:CRAL-TRIO domain-containing protein n=1 Tax=Acanthoscelides obtectus TaxID=200917 RepID=A0A9P0NS11_ACAOB|nr:unnamed protein product [Acanthoscelides obtectus]CAK1661452.1 Alpha-tocopherol transfer protein-like [Acanthoscelides obtectus]
MEVSRKLDFNYTAQDVIDQNRTKQEFIGSIKNWLLMSNDKLVPPHLEEQMIVQFLLSCDNDVELTKTTISAFYRLKKATPELYDDRGMRRADIIKALNTMHMATLPVRTDDNCAIHYFKLNDTDYHNYDVYPIMKLSFMLVDITLNTNPPDGLVVLLDMKGIGLMHLTKMKISAIKKYFQFLQEGFPMKLKMIHIIHAAYVMEKLMSVIKVFIKNEVLDMIKIHPSDMPIEKLHALLPQKCLPEEYGGDLPSEMELHKMTIEQMNNMQKFWEVEEMMRKEMNK